MSLIQLLSVGKSLDGVSAPPSPYRISRSNLLPRFGPARQFSPTIHVENTVAAANRAAALAARFAVTVAAPVAVDFKSPSETTRAPRAESAVIISLGDTCAPKSADQDSPSVNAAPTAKAASPGRSLTAVTVVRNDLSDSDLEVVRARSAAKPAPRAVANPSPAPVKSANAVWRWLTARVFRLGQARPTI